MSPRPVVAAALAGPSRPDLPLTRSGPPGCMPHEPPDATENPSKGSASSRATAGPMARVRGCTTCSPTLSSGCPRPCSPTARSSPSASPMASPTSPRARGHRAAPPPRAARDPHRDRPRHVVRRPLRPAPRAPARRRRRPPAHQAAAAVPSGSHDHHRVCARGRGDGWLRLLDEPTPLGHAGEQVGRGAPVTITQVQKALVGVVENGGSDRPNASR